MLLWFNKSGRALLENSSEIGIPKEKVLYAPLYRHPSKIWGIGLNYVDHASDLAGSLQRACQFYETGYNNNRPGG